MIARSAMNASPDYDIRIVHPSVLREPETNPNVMPQDKYALLVKSIETVGFLQPICVREVGGVLVIVDGVHRKRAASDAGLTRIPVIVGDFQEDDDLADVVQVSMNRLRGELNLASVAETAHRLAKSGWDLSNLQLLGYKSNELTDLLEMASRRDRDVMEEPVAPANDDEERGPESKPEPTAFNLELSFNARKDLARAKKALRKAAGGTNDFGTGLLNLIDAE